MAEIIEITDTTKFKATLEEVGQTQEYTVIVFTGQADASGKNWCSDCERAKPNLKNVLLANT